MGSGTCVCARKAFCRIVSALWMLLIITSIIVGFQITDYTTQDKFKGMALDSNTSKLIFARSSVECCSVCAVTSNCKSVNFCVNTNQCFLNYQDVCDTGDSALLATPGCIYYDTSFHPEEQVIQSLCTPSPCLNGGTCAVICGTAQTACSCVSSYFGQYCQNVDGNWGNWGSYSTCSGCLKSRTRYCNDPSPQGTGLSCEGTSSETVACSEDSCESDDDS